MTMEASGTIELCQNKYEPKNSHPELVRIDWQEGFHNSCLRAQRSFKAGDTLCSIDGIKPGPKRWSTIQVSRNHHIELCSDLLYLNHSCDPNMFVDVQLASRYVGQHIQAENEDADEKLLSPPSGHIGYIRVLKDIQKDDPITFFYPSTEWEMDQPFQCHCQTDVSHERGFPE
jgi:hypothetical protein